MLGTSQKIISKETENLDLVAVALEIVILTMSAMGISYVSAGEARLQALLLAATLIFQDAVAPQNLLTTVLLPLTTYSTMRLTMPSPSLARITV